MMLFIWGIAAQYVLDGPSVIRTVFVITDKPQDISRQVFERLSIGITSWSVKGMFTDRKRTLIFCTVNRADVNALRAVILKAEPHAFVVVGEAHQSTEGMTHSRPNRLVPK